jgi:hypothetical protein
MLFVIERHALFLFSCQETKPPHADCDGEPAPAPKNGATARKAANSALYKTREM